MGIKQTVAVVTLLGSLGFLPASLVLAQSPTPPSAAQSAELAEAEQLNQQVEQLYEQGKYTEAIPLAERVLAIHKRILSESHPDVASSLNNLAFLYKSQGRYNEAEPLYRQALELRKRLLGENHPDVATSLNNLAALYDSQGRYSEAEPLFKQALELRKRLLGENHPDVANSLNSLAFLYDSQGRYSEAEPLYRQALELRKRLLGENHPDVTNSLNNLAGLYYSQGRYSEAEPLFKQALELRKHLLGENHPNVATSLNNLAGLYDSQGRYSEAEPLYQQALEQRKRLLGENHPDVANSLNNLAALYDSQGRYNEAEPLYQQALELSKRLLGENHPDVASSLNNLAFLYQNQGRYSEAEPLFKQALELRKRLLGENHPNVATSLNNLAGLYKSQGRYSEAEPLYQQALELSKRLLGENHPDVATSLNNLAALYKSQGRYTEAEPLYQQALELSKRLLGENHPDVATSLNNLAALYKSQGRYSEAEPLYQQALELSKRLLGENHPDVASNLNNLAGLYYSQGRYSEAEPLYQQALELSKCLLGENHPDVASNLNNLAGLYYSQGRYSEAEPLYQQALELSKRLLGENHPNVATSLNNLAFLYYSQGDFVRAVELLNQGLQIQERNLEINLSAGAEQQKQDYIATLNGTTNGAISLHLQSVATNPDAARLAFTTIVRRKGRILDTLTGSLNRLRQNLTPDDQQRLAQLNDTYAQLAKLYYGGLGQLSPEQYRAQIAQLEQKATQQSKELNDRSAEFRVASQPITLEATQTLIPADAALVELAQYQPVNPKAKTSERYGKPHYAAYILPASGALQWVELGEAQPIDQALADLRQDLHDPDTPIPQLKQSARTLDALLMQPIRQHLGTIHNILLSPDAALNLLPFEALVDEDNRYLLETYSFTYLTSGRDLLRLQNPKPNTHPAVLIADPFFDRPGTVAARPNRAFDLSKLAFPPLKGTAEEAKAIAPLLGVQPLLGSDATETAVKQVNSPRILHIATHGFFQNPQSSSEGISGTAISNSNPLLLSGLVFAGFRLGKSGSDDGILSALEVTNLNLAGTKLVALSACDTGLGNVTTGEGIYGLRRALVIAGAQSQVISLWKVSDDATKDLMIHYYQRLQANQGRSAALHQTQLDMLHSQNYSHPYYWAAFIPSGDWRPIGD